MSESPAVSSWRKRVTLWIAVLSLTGGFVAATVWEFQPFIPQIRGSRGQWLVPDSSAYLVRTQVLGWAPLESRPPETLELTIAAGPIAWHAEAPGDPWNAFVDVQETIRIRPSDRMCFALLGEGREERIGPLTPAVIRAILQRRAAPAVQPAALDEEAAELAELLTRVCASGDAVLCFPEPGGKSTGQLRHFEGKGEGSQGYRSVGRASFGGVWTISSGLLAGALVLARWLLRRVQRDD